MLVEADISLGKIIEALKANGELEKTLIIFTSDNGGLSRGLSGKHKGGHNSNSGFRGSKAQVYEGGHRVPFIARWGNGNEHSPIKPGALSDGNWSADSMQHLLKLLYSRCKNLMV